MRGLPCEDSWRKSRECANLLAGLPVFAVLWTLTSEGPYNSNHILKVHQTVSPGGLSAAPNGLADIVSLNVWRTPHPDLILTSIPTATRSPGRFALSAEGSGCGRPNSPLFEEPGRGNSSRLFAALQSYD